MLQPLDTMNRRAGLTLEQWDNGRFQVRKVAIM